MQIANPIYDVVFKYLMEDDEAARLLLSTILGEEVVELTFLPQERTILMDRRSLTVYRLDFSARIRLPNGEQKQVIIEIQKAKFATDIMRFRRYLGAQYQNAAHTFTRTVGGKSATVALPIVSVYFLGYPLSQTTAPVIRVARAYSDATTSEPILTREDFIESLTHDSYVIQIPHLRPTHKTDLERLLSVFDQQHATANAHILTIDEAEFPEKYRPVIRRLQRAIAEPDVQETMDAEDDILQELEAMERVIEEQQQTLEEKEKVLGEKDKMLEEKDKALEEQERLIAELRKQVGARAAE